MLIYFLQEFNEPTFLSLLCSYIFYYRKKFQNENFHMRKPSKLLLKSFIGLWKAKNRILCEPVEL